MQIEIDHHLFMIPTVENDVIRMTFNSKNELDLFLHYFHIEHYDLAIPKQKEQYTIRYNTTRVDLTQFLNH